MAHGTERYAKMGGLRDKLDGGVKERHKSHASRAQQQRHELIAHKTYQYIQTLYAAKQPRKFQYVAITLVALFVHNSLKTNAKVSKLL
jgi:hypothetical protein